jgi:hypothetical protein
LKSTGIETHRGTALFKGGCQCGNIRFTLTSEPIVVYGCHACGSRTHHAFNPEDEFLSIKGGALDSAHELNPVANIWLRSAHEWIKPKLSEMPGYPTQPDSFDEIVALYQLANRTED